MTLEIQKYLVHNWDALGLKRNPPKRISFLGIRGSLEGNKFIFSVFADNDKTPILIVKLPRYPNDSRSLEKEKQSLLQLRASTSTIVQESIPRVLLLEQMSNQWVLVENFMDGKLMIPFLDRNGLPKREPLKRHFEIVTTWLLQFKNEISNRIILDSNSINEYVIKPIEEFQRNSNLSKDAVDYLNHLRTIAGELRDCSAPLFFQHGDFLPANILLERNKIKIVDWEFSRKMAFPLFDEFSFITDYCCNSAEKSGRMNYSEAFRTLYFSKNWLSRFCKDWLQSYCRKLDIPSKYVKFYFAMFLINYANQEYSQLLEELNRGDFMPLRENLVSKRMYYRELMKEQLYVCLFELLVKERIYFLTV